MRLWLVAALGLLILAVCLYCAYADTKPPTPGDPDIVEGQKPAKTTPIVIIMPPGQLFSFRHLSVWLYRFGEPQSRSFKERRSDENSKIFKEASHLRWLRR